MYDQERESEVENKFYEVENNVPALHKKRSIYIRRLVIKSDIFNFFKYQQAKKKSQNLEWKAEGEGRGKGACIDVKWIEK